MRFDLKHLHRWVSEELYVLHTQYYYILRLGFGPHTRLDRNQIIISTTVPKWNEAIEICNANLTTWPNFLQPSTLKICWSTDFKKLRNDWYRNDTKRILAKIWMTALVYIFYGIFFIIKEPKSSQEVGAGFFGLHKGMLNVHRPDQWHSLHVTDIPSACGQVYHLWNYF